MTREILTQTGISKQPKKYPFSIRKHGHDLEFRMNRCFCLMHDMEMGEIPMDEKLYDEMEQLRENIQEILLYYVNNQGIAFLPGKLLGIAKESVLWAGIQRGQ